MDHQEHVGVVVEQALLGVDPGEKRIGIALKPADSITPQPLEIITDITHACQRIVELSEQNSVDAVVVGLPRDINGNDTAQTAKARAFAGELSGKTKLHILMYDEFDTSQRARDRLNAPTRQAEKSQLDAVAATILLEDYLESIA